MTAALNATGDEVWLIVTRYAPWQHGPYSREATFETKAYPREDLAKKAWKRTYGRRRMFRVDLTAGAATLLREDPA